MNVHDDLANALLRYRGGITKCNMLEILKGMEHMEESISCCTESPYINIDIINSYLSPYKDKFSVLDLNIQSLNSKFETLMVFLNQLASVSFYFSAICLQSPPLSSGRG